MSTISLIRFIPDVAMSSRRPTNGLTKYAPTFAARSACVGEKTSVTLTFLPSDESALHALTPSFVNGTFTTMCSSLAAFTDHPVGIGRDNLGAGRSFDDLADLLQDGFVVAAFLRQERWIGRDAVDD